jgi:hypothetical protein
MSRNPTKPTRNLLLWGILLFIIVGFAGISAAVAKVSFSTLILILVAFAEAGLIILGITMAQNRPESSIKTQENV